MEVVRLERVDRSQTMSRFYELFLDRDLFGQWLLARRWGRIGTEGEEVRSWSFSNREGAIVKLHQYCQQKINSGYVVADDPHGLMVKRRSIGHRERDEIDRTADELDRLIGDVPGGHKTALGRIAASLATVCRHRRMQKPWKHQPTQRELPLVFRDDIDYRIRSRIFQMVGTLVGSVLRDSDVAAIDRMIREGSNATIDDSIVRFVPKTRAPYLNFGVGSFFSGDAALGRIVAAMLARGVRFLGQVVQLSFDELLIIAEGDRALVKRVERHLQRVGLQIQARATWWCPPGQPMRAALRL